MAENLVEASDEALAVVRRQSAEMGVDLSSFDDSQLKTVMALGGIYSLSLAGQIVVEIRDLLAATSIMWPVLEKMKSIGDSVREAYNKETEGG